MNVLIAVKNGVSMSVINGMDFPIFKVTDDNAHIACSNKQTAESFAMKTGGEMVENQNFDFNFEVRVKLSKFDRIITADSWSEIITKHIING